MMIVGTAEQTRRALARSSSEGMSSQGWKPSLWPMSETTLRSWSMIGPPELAMAGQQLAYRLGYRPLAADRRQEGVVLGLGGRWPSNSRNHTSSSERLSASSTAEYCR